MIRQINVRPQMLRHRERFRQHAIAFQRGDGLQLKGEYLSPGQKGVWALNE